MTGSTDDKRDFFVSFNQADRKWATWIAWVLEDAGYSVFFQDWDFKGSFLEQMHQASLRAGRTLVVLSDGYLRSEYARSEAWAALARDPVGRQDRAVIVKVGPIWDLGFFSHFACLDLRDSKEADAERLLLERARKSLDPTYRPKPSTRPAFPGRSATKPPFPAPAVGPVDLVRGQFVDIQDCVRRLRRDRNSAWQFCESLEDYVAWLDQALDDLSQAGLSRIREAHVQLIHLAAEARRDWEGFFELVPLGTIMSKLDQLTPCPPMGLDQGWMGNDRDEHDRPHKAILEELLDEITRVERKIDDLKETLARQDWLGLRSDLKELRFLLRRNPLKLADVSTVKMRLARIETDVLRRTIVLTQILLGCHADRLQPGAVFQDAENAPELVVIPAGRFDMGSPRNDKGRNDDEGPQHQVWIAHRFAVSRYPLTFEEYDRFVEATVWKLPDNLDSGRGCRPVINVSWEDAQAYVAWLSQDTGKPYRLLSEAEWEYAARAGTTTRYSWGDDPPTPEQANFGGRRITEVGSYPANPWGLHDMHGNVLEWVEDCWNDSYQGSPTDGSAWTTGECTRRVLRGGSWVNPPVSLRSTSRLSFDSDSRSYNVGFRVARTLSPSSSRSRRQSIVT